MKKYNSVSLCMIVKNEEDNLYRCLDSVKDLVDEIIIVDTGSIDNTLKIAEQFDSKIYSYKWNKSFSDARNFSLSKATGNFILLMDADDEFCIEDKEKFRKIINNPQKEVYFFKTLSFTGNGNEQNDVINNLNPRLVKNNNQYKFFGDIHEQLNHISQNWGKFQYSVEDIRIYHYGYLTKNIEKKEKRNRNTEIILNQLEHDPNNEFYKFNLATEYFADGKIEEALKYYNDIYSNLNKNKGYMPKTIIRRIFCFEYMNDYKNAFKAIDEGLQIYPNYTDLEYERGILNKRLKKYTLAIESFCKCIQMGQPSSSLEFFNGVSTFKPSYELAKIYAFFKDYKKALIYYEDALKLNSKNYVLLYDIAKYLNIVYDDKKIVVREISKYFDENKGNNKLLISKILISVNLYNEANELLEEAIEDECDKENLYLLKAQICFYNKNYDEAKKIINGISKQSNKYNEAFKFQILIELLTEGRISKDTFELLKQHSRVFRNVILQLEDVLNDDKITYIEEEDATESLQIIIEYLREILRARELEIFEKCLYILNKIESNTVLYALGKLYYYEGFESLTVKEFLRSIKELDYVNEEMIDIIFQNKIF